MASSRADAARHQPLAFDFGLVCLVIFRVLIDIPGVIKRRIGENILHRQQLVIMACSWLLYLCIPLRPTSCSVGYLFASSERMASTLAL